MTHNLKVLGLALFALLAMGAITAVSVSAQEGEFYETTSNYPLHLLGVDVAPAAGEPTASLASVTGTIECTTALYTANLAATTKRITVTPTYSGCSTGTGQPITITMNDCDYELHHATTSGAPDADTWNVTTDLKCSGLNRVEIHEYSNATNHATSTSNCTTTYLPQDSLSGAVVAEETGSNDALRLYGTVVLESQTHGTCVFGFTVGLEDTLHLSATITATEGKKVGIKHG